MRIRFNFTPTPDPTERHEPDPPRYAFDEMRELDYPEGQIEDAKETGYIELGGVTNKVNKYAVTAWRYLPDHEGMTDGLEMDVTNLWPPVVRPQA